MTIRTRGQFAIGVDIGGTKIGFTLINRQGRSLADFRIPTNPSEGAETVLDRVAEGIASLLNQANGPVEGIGVGYPGYIDPQSGNALHSSNLGWAEIPLRKGIQQRLDSSHSIFVGIDANAGTLGELYFGAARDFQDFVYVTIGTGLGGGAVVSGELLLGRNAYAMEVGHFSLDKAGRLCRCGLRGCPEMYASGIGLLAGVREHVPDFPQSILVEVAKLSTARILAAARAHDELALVVMDEAIEWLCKVLVCCVSFLNPALLVIGGGLGHAAADFFIDGVKERIVNRTVPMTHRHFEVRESQVSNSAVGAACLVWHQSRTSRTGG